MLSNPIVQRYRYSILRPKQFWLYQIIYFGIIGLIIFINVIISLDSQQKNLNLFRNMYYQILTFEILILWFWGSYNVGSAIWNELNRKTYDFFKLMPIPANRKAIGILVGTNLLVLLFAAYNLLFLIIFGFLGSIKFSSNVYTFLAVISVALLLNTASLLGSVQAKQKHIQTSATALILLGLILAPLAIIGIISLSESRIMDSAIRFYFLPIPTPLIVTLISLYFFSWSFVGIVRKFNFERRPLFTYTGALWFLVGFSILVSGFYWPYLNTAGMPGLYLLWLNIFIPLILIPFGSAKTYDIYIEDLRLSRHSRSDSFMIWRIFKNSNLSLWLCLFMIWLVFSVGMGLKASVLPQTSLLSFLLFFSFILFLSTLFEIHTLFRPVNSKLKWLLWFLLMIYVLLPLILSIALKKEDIFLFSPIGYVMYLEAQATGDKSIGFPSTAMLLNFLLCIIPFVLIWHKYIQIINIRRRMMDKIVTETREKM